ncbi:MAG: disulfide bond formation protein B [Pseudomonadota bacterium]
MTITRLFYLALFTICLSLLGFGLYLEHAQGIEPCPLCAFQRMCYIAILFITLIGAIHNTQNILGTTYKILILIASLIGAGIAGRQVWLQHLPPELVPECGPGLEYMMEVFPFMDAMKMILSGSGECAEVHWTFLTLSIAEWSLICFSLIAIATLLVTLVFKNR